MFPLNPLSSAVSNATAVPEFIFYKKACILNRLHERTPENSKLKVSKKEAKKRPPAIFSLAMKGPIERRKALEGLKVL